MKRFTLFAIVVATCFLLGWHFALSGEKDKDFAAELVRIPPKEPKDAIKSFTLAPGFRIELVACEPLIRSPVAIDFDEDGRLYVCEFPEYNLHDDPTFKEKGCVKRLEDTGVITGYRAVLSDASGEILQHLSRDLDRDESGRAAPARPAQAAVRAGAASAG